MSKSLGIGIIGCDSKNIVKDIVGSYNTELCIYPNDSNVELCIYTNDSKPKMNFIKETIRKCNEEYLVFLDNSFKIIPNYIQIIKDAIRLKPDCLSCGFKDSFGTTMYSINKWNKGIDTEYPSYFNVIKTKHWKSLDIPDIDGLIERCISDLFMESGILREECYIFDILISKEE